MFSLILPRSNWVLSLWACTTSLIRELLHIWSRSQTAWDIALSEPNLLLLMLHKALVCHRFHYRDGRKVDLSPLMIFTDLKEWMMKIRQMWILNSFIFPAICLSHITWCGILGGFYYISVSKCLILGCYFLDDFCMVIFPFWGIQTLPVLTIT